MVNPYTTNLNERMFSAQNKVWMLGGINAIFPRNSAHAHLGSGLRKHFVTKTLKTENAKSFNGVTINTKRIQHKNQQNTALLKQKFNARQEFV